MRTNLALGVLLGIGSVGSGVATQQTQQGDKLKKDFNDAIKKIDEALSHDKKECDYFSDSNRLERVAWDFMRSPSVDCARRIFEGWKNLESKPSFYQNKSTGSVDQEGLTKNLVNGVKKLLCDFGLRDEYRNQILAALKKAGKDGSLRWFNGIDDPDLGKYNGHSRSTFGNGAFVPWDFCFEGTLDANDPDGALILMMHEVGHAYDCLKYGLGGRPSDEYISILFELLTACSSPELFKAYLNSTLFFMRALRYLPCVFMNKTLHNLDFWKKRFDEKSKQELLDEVMEAMIEDEGGIKGYITDHPNASAIFKVFAERVLGFMNDEYRVTYSPYFISNAIGTYTEPFIKAYQLLMDPRSQGKSLDELCDLLVRGLEINFDDLRNVNINLKK